MAWERVPRPVTCREPEVVAHNAATGVSLRTITRANFRAVMRLSVSQEQQNYVAGNWVSVAEAYVEESFQPFSIYHGHEPVGFTMYGYDDESGRWWIIRLMLDEQHQAKGYGRAAMLLLIDLMRSRQGMSEIYTSHVPDNEVAGRLYRQLGFEDTGQIDEGEVLLRLSLDAAGV